MNTPHEISRAIKPIGVVLAEDHRAIGKLLVRLLESRGTYKVLSHETHGERVAAVCRQHRAQLLILDRELPDMDGLEVARQAISESPGTNILLFSGVLDASTVAHALRVGICGIIDKVAGLDAFLEGAGKVSLGREYYSPSVLSLMSEAAALVKGGRRTELTPRETEVLALIAGGWSSRQIAAELKLSERTVGNHRTNIMGKLGARNVADATREASRLGLLPRGSRYEATAR